jgi:hypothetical protein
MSSVASPRLVGMDDWAYKRGQKYGTILVDLERHRVTDLMSDRTTDTVAAWLKNQPSIEVTAVIVRAPMPKPHARERPRLNKWPPAGMYCRT